MYIYIYIFVCVCTHSIDPIAYHFIDIKNQPITCFLALTGIYHINPLSLYVTLGLTMSHYADTLVQNKRLKPHVCCGPIEGKKQFPPFAALQKLLQEWRHGKAAMYHPSPGPCAVAPTDLTETLGIDDSWTMVP